MSVLFITEGGSQYGAGHITRCHAIACALSEDWQKNIFIIDAPDGFAVPVNAHSIYFDWKEDWQRVIFEIDQIMQNDRIDAVIVDSYYVTADLFRKFNSLDLPLFIIDDQNIYDNRYGVVIAPCLYSSKGSYSVRSQTAIYAGIKFAPLRKTFWKVEPPPLDKRTGILVTLGGSDTSETLQRIVFALNDCGEKVTVVAGASKPLQHGNNINVISGVLDSDMFKTQLLASKFVICGGGGTLMEAARCGTPAIVIKIADNQALNIQAWREIGFARYVGKADDIDLDVKILGCLTKLANEQSWNAASHAGRVSIDGQGSRRIALLINNPPRDLRSKECIKESFSHNGLHVKNFIECTIIERADILAARNSEKVLRGRINQDTLTKEQFDAFIDTLARSQQSGYWRIYRSGKPLGVISLVYIDYDNNSATLGYYKDSKCEEKNIGKLLVETAVYISFHIIKLSYLYAETMCNNHVSMQSLESAGFQNTGMDKRKIGGKVESVYLYELCR